MLAEGQRSIKTLHCEAYVFASFSFCFGFGINLAGLFDLFVRKHNSLPLDVGSEWGYLGSSYLKSMSSQNFKDANTMTSQKLL